MPSCGEKLNKVSASFYALNDSENPSINPLHVACFVFQVDACDSKSYSESRLWFWKLFWKPATTYKVYTEEIDLWPTYDTNDQPMTESNRNSDAALEHSSEFVLQRSKQELFNLQR